MKHFEVYLVSSHHLTMIYTDHNPLGFVNQPENTASMTMLQFVCLYVWVQAQSEDVSETLSQCRTSICSLISTIQQHWTGGVIGFKWLLPLLRVPCFTESQRLCKSFDSCLCAAYSFEKWSKCRELGRAMKQTASQTSICMNQTANSLGVRKVVLSVLQRGS